MVVWGDWWGAGTKTTWLGSGKDLTLSKNNCVLSRTVTYLWNLRNKSVSTFKLRVWDLCDLWKLLWQVKMKTDSATSWFISCPKCLQKHISLSYFWKIRWSLQISGNVGLIWNLGARLKWRSSNRVQPVSVWEHRVDLRQTRSGRNSGFLGHRPVFDPPNHHPTRTSLDL